MTLSRCGRKYPDFGSALKSAAARNYKSNKTKWQAMWCPFGDHWHVIEKGGSVSAAAKLDPFPPAVRAQLVTRDEYCQRCGFTGRLEAHHRRAKSSGGSKARSHTQCACNGVMLCRRCHEWVHRNPKQSRAEGWIVLQSVSEPGSVGMQPAHYYHATGFIGSERQWPVYPACEGYWNWRPSD